jgi:hypothetical protein
MAITPGGGPPPFPARYEVWCIQCFCCRSLHTWLKLTLSRSIISGTATFVDPDGRHRHVFRLHIHHPPFGFGAAVRQITSWLPSAAVRGSIRTLFPGPFLPPTIIVKQLKPGWDAEFEAEKQTYQKLAPIQGHAIPTLYGEGRVVHNSNSSSNNTNNNDNSSAVTTTITTTRALLLSDVGDTSLHSAAAGALGKVALKERIKPAVRALLELGVEPADQNPRNYHLVGDRVILLDLEDTAEVEDPGKVDELAEAVADGVAHWTVFYHQHNGGGDY